MKPIQHGTIHAYSKRHCRCADCCDCKRAYQRGYRATKAALGRCRDCSAPCGERQQCARHLAYEARRVKTKRPAVAA